MKLSFNILRAHLGPFAFSFITLMFVFLLQFLMRAIDQLVGKGLSPWVIGELIILSLSYMVVLAVPMSVLVATLMGFGKLASQNEITAMKASGMSFYRMLAPVVIASCVVTYLLVEFNNKVLPEANHRFKVLMIDIRRIKPTLTIVHGLFSQDIPGYSILARKTFENSNDLEGVTIYDYTDPTTAVVVTGERGKVSFSSDYRKLIMDLSNGEIHQLGTRDMQVYRRMRFDKHRIVMNAEGFDFERSSESAFDRGDRELSAEAMLGVVDSLRLMNANARAQALKPAPYYQGMISDPRRAQPGPEVQAARQALGKARNTLANISSQLILLEYNQRKIAEYLVEINKKFSIPAACLVFVFVGAPLGIIARRGSFGVAATFSLGFFVLYWASLIGGEKFADRGLVSPWLGMWFANIVLFVLGVFLTIRMGRETPTINWRYMRRFIPVSFRSTEAEETDEHVRS